MNSLQRIQTVIEGRLPDLVPVCLHNFLSAASEAGIPMEQYRIDPEAMARVYLQAVEKYGYDCIMVDPDTTLLAEAMGAKSDCTPGEPGHISAPAITSLEETVKLSPVNPERDGRIPVLLEAIRILSKAIGGKIAIRGNCDQGAFSLACLVRGNEDFLSDLAEDPDNPHIRQLLEVCYQSHLALHRAVKKAGAHFTSLGDSFCGPDVISPAMFEKFSRPYEERLVRELRADGIFTVIHICGNATRIVEALGEYDFCGFELDYKTDPVKAKRTAGARHVLFGNIDPSGVIARGTPDEVRASAKRLITTWKPGGHFVLNSGCAIPAGTPSNNIHTLVHAAEEFGSYEKRDESGSMPIQRSP